MNKFVAIIMTFVGQLYQQLKKWRELLLLIYLPVLGFLIFIVIQSYYTGISLSYLTRDPIATTNEAFYLGFVSNIGILFWCAAATVCLFTYAFLRYAHQLYPKRSFWLISGLLTFLLLMDDFFLLHEMVVPYYLRIPEKIVMIIYGLLLLGYLWSFRKTIWDGEPLLILAALGFFGASFVGEWLFEQNTWHVITEDGGKLLGVVGWCVYFTVLALKEIGQLVGKGES